MLSDLRLPRSFQHVKSWGFCNLECSKLRPKWAFLRILDFDVKQWAASKTAMKRVYLRVHAGNSLRKQNLHARKRGKGSAKGVCQGWAVEAVAKAVESLIFLYKYIQTFRCDIIWTMFRERRRERYFETIMSPRNFQNSVRERSRKAPGKSL